MRWDLTEDKTVTQLLDQCPASLISPAIKFLSWLIIVILIINQQVSWSIREAAQPNTFFERRIRKKKDLVVYSPSVLHPFLLLKSSHCNLTGWHLTTIRVTSLTQCWPWHAHVHADNHRHHLSNIQGYAQNHRGTGPAQITWRCWCIHITCAAI